MSTCQDGMLDTTRTLSISYSMNIRESYMLLSEERMEVEAFTIHIYLLKIFHFPKSTNQNLCPKVFRFLCRLYIMWNLLLSSTLARLSPIITVPRNKNIETIMAALATYGTVIIPTHSNMPNMTLTRIIRICHII